MTPTEPTFDELLAEGRNLFNRARTPTEVAARRAARALHALAERLVVQDLPAKALGHVADALDALQSELPTVPADSRYARFPVGASVVHALETHAVGGPANAIAVPLAMTIDDDGAVRGATSFGPLYEGTPGVVHGGFVAAVFDQMLGAAAAAAGSAMVTGTMTIRYKRPTPIGVELVFTTRLERSEGRRLVVVGECAAAEELTAEAEAVFVTVDPERYVRS